MGAIDVRIVFAPVLIGLQGMYYFVGLLIAALCVFIAGWWFRGARTQVRFGRPKLTGEPVFTYHFQKKPDWVPREIIRMKALMPGAGCRSLADSFNRRFAHRAVSVSKSYVADTIRKRLYEIMVLRKKLKHRPPKAIPLNHVWGMDLTGKADTHGRIHSILGLVEHGSRANLSLRALRDKSSITLLRSLIDTVERYGRPKILRTDNEPVFTSRLFRFGLWILGIRHERIDRGCPRPPWMAGVRAMQEQLPR